MKEKSNTAEMITLRRSGLSYQRIGNIFGISRQRVHQLVSGYYRLLNHGGWRRHGKLYKCVWYTKLKESALKRDHYKCRKCDSNGRLLIHHIDGDCRNNNVSNLLSVCAACHGSIHGKQGGRSKKERRDMCLATRMSKKKQAEFEGQTEGWKVLYQKDGHLEGQAFASGRIRPEGKWLDERWYRDSYFQPRYSSTQKDYQFGWHIWLTLEGAERWLKGVTCNLVIRKVRFKKPVAYGWQKQCPVVVAKEMMILKEAPC